MKWVIFSALAGVLLVFSAKALNVTVPPGGNLQTAINQVNAAGGGSVILQAGTYTNSVPLNLLSFVTLTGQGPSSTTHCCPVKGIMEVGMRQSEHGVGDYL